MHSSLTYFVRVVKFCFLSQGQPFSDRKLVIVSQSEKKIWSIEGMGLRGVIRESELDL